MNEYINKVDAILAIGEEEPLVWNEDDEYEQGRHNQWENDKTIIESMKPINKLNPALIDALRYIDGCNEDMWQEFVTCMNHRGWDLKWIGNRWS